MKKILKYSLMLAIIVLIGKMIAQELFDNRPFKFEKPTIFISSRVHPGETPASFVLDGIINFLCQDSEQSKVLLD